MNAETVVKLIKGVCLLIINRPNASTKMGRMIAEKVLVEVVGVSPAALPTRHRRHRHLPVLISPQGVRPWRSRPRQWGQNSGLAAPPREPGFRGVGAPLLR